MTADQIIAAIRRRGSNATTIRDAAHEACHALDSKLRGKWERERIHKALLKHCGDRGTLIYYELRARAVEWLMCVEFDVPYKIDEWANICYMETIKTIGAAPPSVGWIVEQMEAQAKRLPTKLMVNRIKELK